MLHGLVDRRHEGVVRDGALVIGVGVRRWNGCECGSDGRRIDGREAVADIPQVGDKLMGERVQSIALFRLQ